MSYDHKPALQIPYHGTAGEELAVRFRIALDGDRFRWKSGSKPLLYGLHRVGDARKVGQVALVEGEFDCHTLWLHGVPALGVPGAANWREDRDAGHLDGIDTVYVVVEPDRGGDTVREWLGRSSIRHRAKLVRLPTKDPSALHLEGTEEFSRRWQAACDNAIPWKQAEAEFGAAERVDAWKLCGRLAGKTDILDELDHDLSELGLVGERRNAKLVYLAVTSQLLDRPVSVAVKGPSSGGKSFVVESTLKLFPLEAFYALSAMSDRALAYSSEPLQHRHLVIYEAAGMASEFATYLIRTLLSEGRLRYETVEKTKDGLTPRLIEREGPTGLIVTTTSLRLHPENETRMLSLTITDTQLQTAAVFRALAREGGESEVDLSPWRALQIWLARGPAAVTIPFAERLAQMMPPVAVRLRRDFKTVLMLIRAHALLHQATRLKDESGCVVATLDDYRAVHALVADLVAEGIDATVKPEVRETVEAAFRLLDGGNTEVRQTDLAQELKLDKSSISRRVAAALDGGFLKNLEDRKGRPARLVLGDPLPADLELLPSADRLAGEDLLHGCGVEMGDSEGHPLQNSGSGSNSVLKLPTPRPETSQMGGAAVKALQIIDAARAVGVTLSIDGDSLLLRSGSPPPQEVLDALTRHKGEVINFLRPDRSGWSAQEWQAFFKDWAAAAFDGGLPRQEAEARAFGACVVEWLNRNPVRSTPERCCGCDGGEREDNVLLPFGIERTGHAWMHSRCWRPWHEHRQTQAIAILQALGIAGSIEFPNDFAKNRGA